MRLACESFVRRITALKNINIMTDLKWKVLATKRRERVEDRTQKLGSGELTDSADICDTEWCEAKCSPNSSRFATALEKPLTLSIAMQPRKQWTCL